MYQQQVAPAAPAAQSSPDATAQATPVAPAVDAFAAVRSAAPSSSISPATATASPESSVAHPLQQHPVSYTVPPPPPATSSFPIEGKSDGEGQDSSQQASQERDQETSQETSQGTSQAAHEDEGHIEGDTDSEDDLESYEEPVVEEAVVAPLRTSPTAVVIPLPSPVAQPRQQRDPSEPSPMSQLLPQINGFLASNQADQASVTDPSVNDSHSRGAASQATSAAPSEIFIHTAEPVHMNGNHTASVVTTVAPLSPSLSTSQSSGVLIGDAVSGGSPAASTPQSQSISSGPIDAIQSTPVVAPPPVSVVTSPIADDGAAAKERDVHDITPPSPIDNMDYDLGEGAAPSATGGLYLPYGNGASVPPSMSKSVENGEGSSGTNGDAGGDINRQKTIRQTPQQEFEEHKRRQFLKDLEEKIPVFVPEADEQLEMQKKREQEEPKMSATSYPGQEWNPYGPYEDDE